MRSLIFDGDLLDLRRPVLEAVTAQMLARVLDEQRLDVVDVATDLLVVRPTAERHQRAGDDVDEAPGEFLERGRVAFARQLVRDAGRDLGDARETADRVVARRHLRKAEMEQIEVLGATGAFGFCVHAPQQVGIALRIEDDDHVAAANVLGDQELGEPRLADPRGAEHEGVSDTLAEIHPDVLLMGLDRMQRRRAADRRQRLERIPPGRLPQHPGDDAEHRHGLPGDLLLPCPSVERARVARSAAPPGGCVSRRRWVCRWVQRNPRPRKSLWRLSGMRSARRR